jgi:hypothetical protein
MRVILVALLLAAALLAPPGVRAQATECNQQLHNYYVSLGMPMVTPVLDAISFVSGSLLGIPFVTVNFAFAQVASFYASLLPMPNITTPVAYVTVDNPWCVSSIAFVCISNATIGLAKTANCTSLVDFDLGGSDPVAGRFFLYNNQTAACNGTSQITFYNVTIMGSGTDTYTYDAVGIKDNVLLDYNQAVLSYVTSTCNATDGTAASMTNQQQFVCVEPLIGCNGTRSGGVPTLGIIPLPSFGCIGNTSGNASAGMIWFVDSLVPIGGVSGVYGFTTVPDLSFASLSEEAFAQTGIQFLLLPQTRRQHLSTIDSFTQYALLFYQGVWTNFVAAYSLSPDPIIELVPCACGFSMLCYPGTQTADTTSVYTQFLDLNNALPISNPGPNLMIGFGTPSFTLTAVASYDPDNAPFPFNVWWKIYSTPYDPSPPPFSIIDPTQINITIPSASLQNGTYAFVLYASDLQSVVPSLLFVSILPNQVFAVVLPSFETTFTFYSGLETNHSCLIFPPQPSIPLNGSLSYETMNSTQVFYQWTQISGYPLTFSCDPTGYTSTAAFFNTTMPIGQFVPPLPGRYCFQLFVTDNATNSTSAQLCVTVDPNFMQPPISLTPIFNFTPPPIRNLTPPTRPILTFPPSEPAPFLNPPPVVGPAPVAVAPTPPFIPIYPPPSRIDILLLIGGFLLFLVVYLALLALWVAYGDTKWNRVWDKKTLGGSYT